ncbi:MAG: hypothetical protein ACRDGS_10140, partial [Chloroflexota bacterium]
VSDPQTARAISGAVVDVQTFVDDGDLHGVREACARLEMLLPSSVEVLAAGRLGSTSSIRNGLNRD